MKYEFEGQIINQDSAVWHFCVLVPDEISKQFGKKRIECTVNKTLKFQCALMPGGDLGCFVNLNKDTRKQLKLAVGDMVHISIEEDKSKYGLPVPDSFLELLEQDVEGEQLFHALTMGKQRSLLHIIDKPKNPDLKLKKALVVFDYLKTTGGKLDFKELNQAFKNSNR